MGLLDQQREIQNKQKTQQNPDQAIERKEFNPADQPSTDLTGMEAQLKAAASNPANMANAKKKGPEDQQDPDFNDISGKTEEELGLIKYTEDDYKLAEEVVFRGFASKDYKFGRNGIFHALLTTTTTGEELIIDEIISEIADKTNISQTSLQHHMAIIMIALSLQQFGGKDFPDNPRLSLNLLKSAMKKLLEFERDGLIDKYTEQRDNIIKIVKSRMSYVKALPTPVLDILAKKRSHLETMVIKLLDGGILKNS